MPIIQHEYINDALLGVWEITEDENTLLSVLQPKKEDLKTLSKVAAQNTRIEKIAARALTKELCTRLDYPYTCIYKNKHGKPMLECDLEISISHSTNYAAAIIAPQKVGIDIQKYTDKIHKVKHRVFTDTEIEMIDDDDMMLIVLWGFKETLYKLYGNRKLTFKRDIIVQDIDFDNKTGTTSIGINGKHNTYQLKYEQIKDHILTYNI